MGDRAAQAERAFQSGLNCAQSLVAAFGDKVPNASDEAIRAAAPLGGGIARSGETCGAVTGALVVLGLVYGSAEPDAESKARVYAESQEFIRRFKEKHGTMSCRELIGCDLSTDEGRQFAQEHQKHKLVCSLLVRDAAEILQEMLKAVG